MCRLHRAIEDFQRDTLRLLASAQREQQPDTASQGRSQPSADTPSVADPYGGGSCDRAAALSLGRAGEERQDGSAVAGDRLASLAQLGSLLQQQLLQLCDAAAASAPSSATCAAQLAAALGTTATQPGAPHGLPRAERVAHLPGAVPTELAVLDSPQSPCKGASGEGGRLAAASPLCCATAAAGPSAGAVPQQASPTQPRRHGLSASAATGAAGRFKVHSCALFEPWLSCEADALLALLRADAVAEGAPHAPHVPSAGPGSTAACSRTPLASPAAAHTACEGTSRATSPWAGQGAAPAAKCAQQAEPSWWPAQASPLPTPCAAARKAQLGTQTTPGGPLIGVDAFAEGEQGSALPFKVDMHMGRMVLAQLAGVCHRNRLRRMSWVMEGQQQKDHGCLAAEGRGLPGREGSAQRTHQQTQQSAAGPGSTAGYDRLVASVPACQHGSGSGDCLEAGAVHGRGGAAACTSAEAEFKAPAVAMGLDAVSQHFAALLQRCRAQLV